MLEFNKVTFIYTLFNEYVFSEAKMNMQYLKLYFYQDPFCSSNSLIKRFLSIIENQEYSNITDGYLNLELMQDGKSEEEISAIIKQINQYKGYTKAQSSIFRKTLRQFCSQGYADYASKQFEGDPEKYLEELKKFDYKSNFSDSFSVKQFSSMDVADLVNDYNSSIYKSSSKMINDSYPLGGYPSGQIVCVCAPPGQGKSLFLMNEANNFINQGLRVHQLILGDMQEIDLIVRFAAIRLGVSITEATRNILRYYELIKDDFTNLFITIVPSATVKVSDYIQYMITHADEYDVLQVDYDANFDKRDNVLSMYDLYGSMYDEFTKLTRLKKLVMVAAQPQRAYWNAELIPEEAIGKLFA